MLALAGIPLGYSFVFVDPSPNAPAAAVGEQLVCGYDDPLGQAALSDCQVVTYEFESVPVEAAQALAERVPVFPPPFALRVAQDRLLEKNCFRSLGIGTAPVRSRRQLGRSDARRRNSGATRGAEDAPARLRRQGAIRAEAPGRRSSGVGRNRASAIDPGRLRALRARAESDRRARPRWRHCSSTRWSKIITGTAS